MFEALARSHQTLSLLCDQKILRGIEQYHQQLLRLFAANPASGDLVSVQSQFQVRCAGIEQQWTDLQHDIRQQLDRLENQLSDLASEKKIHTRNHWIRRLRCNHEFYHTQRELAAEPEDFVELKHFLLTLLPQGYYPVCLLGLDHRHPWVAKELHYYSNPLYVGDIYQESFTVLNQFNTTIRNRILTSVLGSEDNTVGLHNTFPINQFAFVCVWNLFNYFTEEVMQQWLDEIALLLRPGGQVFATYNNCLDPTHAHFVDLGRNSFTIPTRLSAMAARAGLESKTFGSVNSIHYVVLTKPGVLSSARVVPGVGQIMTKI